MNFKKLEFSNPEEDPVQLVQEFSIHTMANVIVSHSDVDETVAVMTAWYCLHQRSPVLLPARHRGNLYRQSDPKTERNQEKRNRFKKLLMLQRAFGGSAGDIGALTLEDTDLTIEFNFPVHNFLERLAEHHGVPIAQLKQNFREQLEQAYTDLIETGEGRLKDFGILHHGDRGSENLVFDIKDEIRAILSSDSVTNHNTDEED